MCLIEVAAVERDLGQSAGCRGSQRRRGAVEPDHTCEHLWSHANLLAETRDQAPMAPAELLGQMADRRLAVRPAKMLPRPRDGGRRRRRLDEPACEKPLDEIESLPPGARFMQPLVELTRLRDDVVELDRPVCQLVHRQAEEAMRGERCEPEV